MKERTSQVINEAFANTYRHGDDIYVHNRRITEYLAQRITALESLLREVVDEPPIVVGDGGACCVFCGAAYDNPHTEACWITRVEKALSGEE
jgi:hypothetical protein